MILSQIYSNDTRSDSFSLWASSRESLHWRLKELAEVFFPNRTFKATADFFLWSSQNNAYIWTSKLEHVQNTFDVFEKRIQSKK